jgi:hypothetical protein
LDVITTFANLQRLKRLAVDEAANLPP